MIESVLAERVLLLSYQRTLPGFEQGLIEVMGRVGAEAWACIFPPSFNTGGHLVIARGIKRDVRVFHGLLRETAGTSPGADRAVQALGRQLDPHDGASCARTLRTAPTKERPHPLIVYLFRRQPDFSPDEVRLAQWLTGHLLQTYLGLTVHLEQELTNRVFRLISDIFAEGICLLDAGLEIRFENEKFRQHLHLWVHQEQAQAQTPTRSSALPEEWKKAATKALEVFHEDLKNNRFGDDGRVAVTTGSVVKLELELRRGDRIEVAVRYLAYASPLGRRPYLFITTTHEQPADTRSIPLERLAREVKLSPRELELARQVLAGRSASEIAAQLHISIPTVKTHISKLLRKSKVGTRLEFISMCRSR